jgi:hypothetical protein
MTPFSPAQPLRAETRLSPGVVLSRPSPCNVPQAYASVAELHAALLGCHFEHLAFGRCSVDAPVGSTYTQFCWDRG